jgi:hypothetical protein
MCDEKGGTKAPDTTLWREHLHAATMVGRLAAAKVAVDLGYGIEADDGPSGKLGHWRVAGIADGALAVHSKRAAEIDEAVAEQGFATYQARQVAARETRKAKRHTAVDDLLPVWRAELEKAGFPPNELAHQVERAGRGYQRANRVSLKPSIIVSGRISFVEGVESMDEPRILGRPRSGDGTRRGGYGLDVVARWGPRCDLLPPGTGVVLRGVARLER